MEKAQRRIKTPAPASRGAIAFIRIFHQTVGKFAVRHWPDRISSATRLERETDKMTEAVLPKDFLWGFATARSAPLSLNVSPYDVFVPAPEAKGDKLTFIYLHSPATKSKERRTRTAVLTASGIPSAASPARSPTAAAATLPATRTTELMKTLPS